MAILPNFDARPVRSGDADAGLAHLDVVSLRRVGGGLNGDVDAILRKRQIATAGAVITSHLESMPVDARQEIARSVDQVESAVGVDERGNAGELAV